MTCETACLISLRKQFRSYKDLGDNAIARLKETDFDYQPEPGSNSIATIIRHLHGNMKSRFTNFLTEDGEKSWRERDKEFLPPASQTQKVDIIGLWEEGWSCVFNTINQLEPAHLLYTVTIRHEPHQAIDALNRQLAHYASHIGQIIYLAKMIQGKNWVSLSIPIGESVLFNQKMARNYTRD